MLAHEIRRKYLDFFIERGHLHMPGAPLVPVDVLGVEDETTLFTGSGMQQFKAYFTGEAVAPNPRVTTVQKCVRTGDIESVGDIQHCTFFEMLGNFSFGDYFKAEVIPWTWQFLTQVVGLDPDRFCVTVYLDDDEAYDIWRNVIGLPEDRVHRLGEDKNFWPANAISVVTPGPCGPCSEVYYRIAPPEEMSADPALSPTERFKVDDDAGRYVEVWNNVFTQFDLSADEQGKAVLTPLPKKNNDTGAGFDRIVMAHQGKRSVFETDLFEPILNEVVRLSGKPYGGTMGPVDFAFRVVAEHIRTIVFCIADGILPANEGRGYVLRYILRRAIRYGRMTLGFDGPFLYQVAPKVIEQMGGFYTELRERQELVLSTIRAEEERFGATLENGMARLSALLDAPETRDAGMLSGEAAFMLYDTYGFPLELTVDIAAERGLKVDQAGFQEAMAEQRRRSKEAAGTREVWAEGEGGVADLQRVAQPTLFLGYGQTEARAKVAAILLDGRLVDSARAGDEVELVLDETPFYAEAGGQVGDTGLITAPAGDVTCALKIEVTDTQKTAGYYLHKAKVLEGEVHTDDVVQAAVDCARRRSIMRNHTATHLLQAALRQVLGPHVHQKGSLVAPDRLRFDFTHNQPMSPDELARVEEIVNARVLDDLPVIVHTDMPIAEAKARGAMALFGEKYGERVRMIEAPGYSLELCGGTHLSHTSQVGLFKIASETGIQAGVRRIEAVTGAGAIGFVNEVERRLEEVARALRSNPRDVLVAAEKLARERADLHKQVQQLKTGAALRPSSTDVQTTDVGGVKLAYGTANADDAETLSTIADAEAKEIKSGVVVLASVSDGKVLWVVKVTPDLVKRGFHAGNLVREVAKVTGGGGGGRPDFAQAGGRDAAKLPDALAKARALVAEQASR